MNESYFVFAGSLAGAFFIAFCLTGMVRRLALRLNFVDNPGERKIHSHPIPLMGGVAIWVTFNLALVAVLLTLWLSEQFGQNWLLGQLYLLFGENAPAKVTGLLAGSLVIFLLGVIDDRVALKPEIKLIGQIIAAVLLVLSGMRIELFVLSNVWLSALITVIWVVLLTNSLNFLDNMDGLAAGVSIIASFSFFLAVQPHDQFLVRLILIIFAGSVAGFLCHNLSPARIFMGDAGSMFCGYVLASVAIMGTFHVESTPSPIAVAAPILALSVPLFDTFSVVYLRWRSGQSIMKGDKRHFSHRLVDLGMSPKQAVEFIYLVAAVSGLGGALLGQIRVEGTLVILCQMAGIYLLIVLLMNAGRNGKRNGIH
jgi:UDP-GlcNAc:undecaprenyl-phosphate GlcNAc-1-phosphate transferase